MPYKGKCHFTSRQFVPATAGVASRFTDSALRQITLRKGSATNSVSALVIGIAVMLLSGLVAGTDYEGGAFLAGMICLSLALPLGQIEYPVQIKKSKMESNICSGVDWNWIAGDFNFAISPLNFMPLFVLYAIGFMIYNWAGLAS